jgi:hypothetical protein
MTEKELSDAERAVMKRIVDGMVLRHSSRRRTDRQTTNSGSLSRAHRPEDKNIAGLASFGASTMARERIIERIRFESTPEAVFQNFRRYAYQARIDVPAMPIFDFGRLLNTGAPGYLGDECYKSIADSYRELTDQIGVRLPHRACSFLNRYVVDVEYFFLGVGTDDGTDTATTWFQWSRRDGWDQIMTQAWRGRGDTAERDLHYTTTNTDPQHRALLLGTITTTLFANLYLIYERGGAVETDERLPATTRGRTGRMRVHPMAPSSVIHIRVNEPRLLRPTEPPTPPPVSGSPTERIEALAWISQTRPTFIL